VEIVRGGGAKPAFGKSAVRVLASSTDMLRGWLWHAASKSRDTATNEWAQAESLVRVILRARFAEVDEGVAHGRPSVMKAMMRIAPPQQVPRRRNTS